MVPEVVPGWYQPRSNLGQHLPVQKNPTLPLGTIYAQKRGTTVVPPTEHLTPTEPILNLSVTLESEETGQARTGLSPGGLTLKAIHAPLSFTRPYPAFLDN